MAGFLLCRDPAVDLADALDAALAEPGRELADVFRKTIIAASVKNLFMKKLRAMNITGESLFPGLDGTGMAVRELIRAI